MDGGTLISKDRTISSLPLSKVSHHIRTHHSPSFYSFFIEVLVQAPLLLPEMGPLSLQKVNKILNNRISQFSRESKKNSACVVHFLQELTVHDIKGCCRQITAPAPLEFWKSPYSRVRPKLTTKKYLKFYPPRISLPTWMKAYRSNTNKLSNLL